MLLFPKYRCRHKATLNPLLFMVIKTDIRFIVIDKQKDLPTELEMKGRIHDATQLEEFIMPNGDNSCL